MNNRARCCLQVWVVWLRVRCVVSKVCMLQQSFYLAGRSGEAEASCSSPQRDTGKEESFQLVVKLHLTLQPQIQETDLSNQWLDKCLNRVIHLCIFLQC